MTDATGEITIPKDKTQSVYPLFFEAAEEVGMPEFEDLRERDRFWKSNANIPKGQELSLAQALRRSREQKDGGDRS